MSHLPSLLLAILALAAPALAQDGSEAVASRSPASAQKFLTMHARAVILFGDQAYEVTEIGSTDACRTDIAIRRRLQTFVGQTLTTTYPDDPRKRVTLDWSKVSKVATFDRPQSYSVVTTTPDEVVPLYYNTAEERERVAAAMRYLQSACDKSAETGF